MRQWAFFPAYPNCVFCDRPAAMVGLGLGQPEIRMVWTCAEHADTGYVEAHCDDRPPNLKLDFTAGGEGER